MNFMFEDLKNNTILGTPISELEEIAEELKHSLIKSINKRLKITVKNILYLTGGNTKVEIRNCNRIEDGWYRNQKSIKYIKERTKNWVEFKDNDIGQLCLCPECYEKYKNGELKF